MTVYWKRYLPWGLVGFTWGWVIWIAASASVEHYDGFEYLLTARTLWGESTYFAPKNTLLCTLLSVLYGLARLIGREFSLVSYHVPMALSLMASFYSLARWMRGLLPSIDIATFLALLSFNRVFLEFTPTVLPDVLAAVSIGFWWYVDITFEWQSPRGRLMRTLAFALCALGRVQTVIIPGVALLVTGLRKKQLRHVVQIIFVGCLLYVVITGIFFSALQPPHLKREFPFDFLKGIAGNYDFNRVYFRAVRTQERASFGEYLSAFYEIFNPAGLVLLVLGASACVRSRKEALVQRLYGPIAGSLAFALFQLWARNIGAHRYFSPLMILWVLLQAMGVRYLETKNSKAWPALCLGLFFLSVIPTGRYFSKPAYRNNLEEITARKIVEWSSGRPLVLLIGGAGPLFSKTNEIHEFDPEFYRYWGGRAAFEFYTGKILSLSQRSASFTRFGFPIPDDLLQLGQEGTTIIVPPMRAPENRVTPIVALRWWRERALGRTCDPNLLDYCVEVISPGKPSE